MAVPPVIPTSFVPRPSIAATSKTPLALMSVLSALAYLLLVLSLVSAAGVFAYNDILASEQTSKDAALAKAESGLDQTTLQQFIRLSNRIASAKTLLANHVALSGVLTLLGNTTPQQVNFSSVSITINAQGNAQITANGTAASFNALAVASDDFGTAQGLSDVIFSGLALAKDGSVGFTLSANINPSLIAYNPASPSPAAATTPTIQTASSTGNAPPSP